MSDERLTMAQTHDLEDWAADYASACPGVECAVRSHNAAKAIIVLLAELRSARAASAEGGGVVAQFVVRDGELVTEAPPAEALCMRCHHPFEDVLHTDPNQCPTVVCVEKHHAFVAPQPTPPSAPRPGCTPEDLQFYAKNAGLVGNLARALLAAESENERMRVVKDESVAAGIQLGKENAALEAQLAESQQLEHEVQNRLLTMADEFEQQLAAHRADKGRIDQYAVGRVDQLTARNAQLVEALTQAKQTLTYVELKAPSYDWNRDRLSLTLLIGRTYTAIDAALVEEPKAGKESST